MTLTTHPPDRPLERLWSREHVRAPHGDESFVAQPELSDAIDVAHHNGERLAAAAVDVQGKTLAALRRWARREILRAAHEYTLKLVPDGAARPLSPEEIDATALYVGGHQPTLFHPGVWIKNFVVGHLARLDRGVGLNLVVDTDTLSGTSIRVPTGESSSLLKKGTGTSRPGGFPGNTDVPLGASPLFQQAASAPGIATVAFDEPRARLPWEEARIIDRPLFATFAERALAALGEREFQPMLARFWPASVERSRHSDSLAECLTAARVAWERSWNVTNLELPVSRLCTLEPFLWFASHVLGHLPRFRSIYNEVLQEYRAINRVRSRTHPVPDLREVDGWLEAPFRVWRAGDEVRRRVFARQEGDQVRLSDGSGVFATLPLAPSKEACCAVRELQKLEARGIRFRTRALTTTLFARLCCADLFVHGIGGAKYDQMTDRITARFFGVEAPEFLTMSATVLLPAADCPADPADERRLRRQLRELDYNSDRHLSPENAREHSGLVAEKRRLVDEQNSVRAARRAGVGNPGAKPAQARSQAGYSRFRRLQELNQALAKLTVPERGRMEEELQQTRGQLAASDVWRDREYAFCLYPADKLQRFMDHVCASARK